MKPTHYVEDEDYSIGDTGLMLADIARAIGVILFVTALCALMVAWFFARLRVW